MKRAQEEAGASGAEHELSGPEGKRARTEDGHFVSRRGRGRGGSRSKGNRFESKLPTMVYREGEPLKDLAQYLEGPDGNPQQVEVRIPPECVTAHNKQVKARQLWGCDVYTEDSDLVAVIMHMGFFSYNAGHPPHPVIEFRATITPMPPQPVYKSRSRNGLFSRAWTAPSRECAYTVDSVRLLTRLGAQVTLEPRLDGAPLLAPTFIPSQHDRAMTTRATAATIEKRQKLKQEVTVQYSLCNEPWLKYTMGIIADRGLRPSQWTSSRLLKEILFLETHSERYEISRTAGTTGGAPDTYRFSKCRRILPLAGIRKHGLPSPSGEIDVLHGDAKWEEFEWNTTGLTLRGKAYPIARVLLVPIHPKEPEVEAKAAVKEEAAVEAGTADKQAEGKGEAPQTDGAGAAGAPPPPPQATVEGAAAVAVGAAAAQGDGGAAVTPPVAPAVAQ